MKYSIEQYAIALYHSISETNPKDHDKVIENFITILRKNDDLQHYEQIVNTFEQYDKQQRGEVDITVTTADDTKLNKKTLDELNKLVGKQGQVTQKTDQSIIGGVVIRADDTMIDGSLKTQLQKLKNFLSRKTN